MKKSNDHIDWYIFLPIIGLLLFSLSFVYSASASFADMRYNDAGKLFWNHTLRVGAALLILLFFAKYDYKKLANFSKANMFIAIGMLIAVFVIGVKVKGASRWLDLGPASFQPSEYAKFALVIHLSHLLAEKGEAIKDLKKGLMPVLFWPIITCILIALQPNFSTALVIFIISYALLFIGNARPKHLLTILGSGLIIAPLYAISAPYRMQRLLAYFGNDNGSEIVERVSYQLDQAILAFGNGGIIGLGPGQSRQSNLYLPESYGDFIFSIVGEEYGFVGATFIIAMFFFILWRGLLAARYAPDKFGYYLAIGIIVTLTIYAFVNAGVNCGLLPTTGLPMPFISYGGSAVLIYAVAAGILLNISAQAGVYTKRKAIKKAKKMANS